ncbi:MAG: hypothetical protein IPJ69_13965 [Deltaproteobacteria bacterium]|nr:MAG: hypothetical protein IPJ69_13965 [Deltaproteobacteria bacterium]
MKNKEKKVLNISDPSWISSNKKGEISPGQQFLFDEMLGLGNFFTYLSMVIFPFLILLPTAIVLKRQYAEKPIDSFFFWIVGIFALSTVIAYGGWLTGILSGRKIKQDLASQCIVEALGQIKMTWRGLKIFADHQEGSIPCVTGYYTIDQPPGAYRLYFLKNSRYILSAEALDSPQSSKNNLLEAFQKVHHFTADDLIQNQRGFLTEFQKKFFLKQFRKELAAAVLWTGFIIFLIFSIFTQDWTLFQSLMVLFILASFYYVYDLAKGAFLIRSDLEAGHVEILEGNVEKVWKVRLRHSDYYYRIENHEFKVPSQAYNIMVPQNQYRIYFLPKSKRLLSIEPL